MLFYTERLTKVLSERFDDVTEINDVAIHGCSGGVSDFIYNKECNDFFNEYEDDIEDVCYDMLGDEWMVTLIKHAKITDIMSLKTHAVWFVVETYCQSIVQDCEEYCAA